MCGRYQFDADTNFRMREMMDELIATFGEKRMERIKTGEIFPSYDMPSLIQPSEKRRESKVIPGAHLTVLHWGIPKGFAPGDHINARSESIQEKKTFREPFLERRCVLPASGFYEWKRDVKPKEKYYFTAKDGAPLWLCGIYTLVDHMPSFALLTTAANESMAPVHTRMPVLVEEKDIAQYLQDTAFARAFIQETPPLLERVLV